ncbi:structural maintenance of chromosomes protein 2-like [Nylanderia fulva]|uniref:structural maintenance of chromosomes protein 2-like n=1 Tax=Nylanderia fulva TaxID=613905 RepID=UPI0010FBB79D|nr:structural maintenance of chromosomes protein 2-like [Nylanderia fulva]
MGLLRVSNYKELINNKCKECKVTLRFNNNDKEGSPLGYNHYDEIVVSRCIDSDGKSKYSVNGHSCSSLTVSKMFGSIGLSSVKGSSSPYFVIMQGHITKILNMKSKDLCELVEETAGIRGYEMEKEKAMAMLEKKENKLIEAKESLFRRISPFFDKLKCERDAYLEQERCEEKREINRARKEEIEEMLTKSEVGNLKKALEETLKVYMEERVALEEIENRMDQIKDESEEVDILGIQISIDQEYRNINKVKKEKNEVLSKIGLLSRELESVSEVPENNKICDILDVLRERESYLTRELKNKEMCKSGIKTTISCVEEKIEELRKLKRRREELEYVKKQENMKEEEGLMKESLLSLMERIEMVEEMEREMNELKHTISDMKKRLNYPYGKEGIYGTVDENIWVKSDKYGSLVDTIMGGRGKYIIVENEKLGVELLKNTNRKINVIPLNKIKGKILNSNILKEIRKSGGVNVMDVLRYNEKVKKAIEHVFNNYFIFEDSNSAKRVCFEYKVVCITLSGTIYDPKGTLTGGELPRYNHVVIRKLEIMENERRVKELKDGINNTLDEISKESVVFGSINIKCDITNELDSLRDRVRERIDRWERLERVEKDITLVSSRIDFISNLLNGSSKGEIELDELRREILEKERLKNETEKNNLKREEFRNELRELEKKRKMIELEEERISSKINLCKRSVRECDIRNSKKSVSEREERMLEPKREYLVKNLNKSKNKMKKIHSKIEESLNKGGISYPTEGESFLLKETERKMKRVSVREECLMNDEVENEGVGEEKVREILRELGINERIFHLVSLPISREEEESLKREYFNIQREMESLRGVRKTKMDPKNFDLLEKNEESIKALEEKITRLENDKGKIKQSIEELNKLSKTEM